jgi:hypothetical protein
MEQRTAIQFCVKLKKRATEKFKMLKSAHGEEHEVQGRARVVTRQ